MGELTYLLSSYSGGELVMIFVAGLLAVTAILKAASYVWEKVKAYLNIKSEDTHWREKLDAKLDNISQDTTDLKSEIEVIKKNAGKRAERLKKVEEFVQADYEREEEIISQHNMMKDMCKRVQARLQDDTRWAFKDAYNYYYVREHKIDTHTLEALEKKYEHYKLAGGNSFVDNIMTKLRELPIVETMGDEVNG